MGQKLSPYKTTRMIELYFKGFSQAEVAQKLKIDQSTVSLYAEEFKYLAGHEGLIAAGKEFNVMEQVKELRGLAVDLKKAKLTAVEAKAGLKVAVALQQCGVDQEDYKDLIQACTKMKAEGFTASAVRLNKLEADTGMTWEEIVDKAADAHEKLEKAEQGLQDLTVKLNTTTDELAAIDEKKTLATEELEAYMKKAGVDMARLESVEKLALALKEAGISDEQLGDYVQRQQQLNKASISPDILAAILDKAKVITWHDHGAELLEKLSEYGGLTETIQSMQVKAQSLEKQAEGLEQKAKLKGEVEADTAKLKAEKASLEAYVAQLHTQKAELDKVQGEVDSLVKKKVALVKDIDKLGNRQGALNQDIKAQEQKVGDLKELESKHKALSQSLSEIEAKINQNKERLEVFESFIGLIDSSSLPNLEEFAASLPKLLEKVKQGKHSPEVIRNFVLNKLGISGLQILTCTSCETRFDVDKPPGPSGYRCPVCGLTYDVAVDKDAAAILKAALAIQKPRTLEVKLKKIDIKKHGQKDEDSG